MTEHVTKVVFQRAWREHRPECSCGWIGSYWKSEGAADREAEKHRETGEDDPMGTGKYTTNEQCPCYRCTQERGDTVGGSSGACASELPNGRRRAAGR